MPPQDPLISRNIPSSPPRDGYSTMEKVDPHEPIRRPSVLRRRSFLVEFSTSKGPPQIVAIVLLVALGAGATIGIGPAIMTDRFARLNHGYDGEDCSHFVNFEDKPEECLAGSADAQNGAAYASLVSNMLTLLSSSFMGSLSDMHGRKVLLCVGMFLSLMSPLALMSCQLFAWINPIFYYSAQSISGLVNWMAIALSALSDVLPPEWRAPGVGILMAGFMLGLCISPTLAVFLTRLQVTVLSFCVVFSGFLVACFFFQETLPEHVAEQARLRREREDEGEERTNLGRILRVLTTPFREMGILNRNSFFRLMTALAFFSGMANAGDQTLLIYYVQTKLSFTPQDVAILFLMLGAGGVLAQAVVLKPLNDMIGERHIIILCFLLSSIDNIMYGLAQNKGTVFAAIAIGGLSGMAFPTISAIKANNVHESEQGRIQGALYSIQAVASGIGPVLMRSADSALGSSTAIGSGIMFLFAACLNFTALFFAFSLPKDKANSRPSAVADVDGRSAIPLPLLAVEEDNDLTDTLI